MSCSTSCKLTGFSVAGLFLATLGTMFVVYWPQIFNSILTHELALTDSSTSFKIWEVIPIPMYIEFYLFNWTNVKEWEAHKANPILEQVGPFVFREHRRKVIDAWNPQNATITFYQNRTWFYEESMSNGSLDGLITTINVPAVTAAFSMRHESKIKKEAVNIGMNFLRTRISVEKPIRQLLFDGYTDPLLDLAGLVPPGFINTTIPFDKFGWFYTRNGSATYDGLFNMQTGVEDISQLGKLSNWDYQSSTSFYESYCGNVNGSAGELFPPKRDKTTIGLFSPDICRTLSLTFKEELTVDSIPAYRYWGDDKMFANQTSSPDNWCFCPSGECSPNGVLDVSTCKWGAPAFISFPHFYHADPYYRNAVIGMKPEEDLHQMYIDIEPRTGIPLEVSAAFQINILVQPMKEFTILKDVPKVYFPAIWFRQTARIDDDIGSQLRLLLKIPVIGTVISYIILCIGVTVLFVISIVYITVICRREDETLYLSSMFPRSKSILSRWFSQIRIRNSYLRKIMPQSGTSQCSPNENRSPYFIPSPEVNGPSAALFALPSETINTAARRNPPTSANTFSHPRV